MDRIDVFMKTFIATFGAFCGYFLGGWDTTLKVLVIMVAQLDSAFGSNSAIREATIFFFIGNELLSHLENAGRMGIPLPSALTNAVEILGGKQKQVERKGEVE